MDGEIRQQFEQMNRQFEQMNRQFEQVNGQLHRQGVLLEEVRADVKGVAEGVASANERIDREFAALSLKLDERIQPIEVATKNLYRTRRKPNVS